MNVDTGKAYIGDQVARALARGERLVRISNLAASKIQAGRAALADLTKTARQRRRDRRAHARKTQTSVRTAEATRKRAERKKLRKAQKRNRVASANLSRGW